MTESAGEERVVPPISRKAIARMEQENREARVARAVAVCKQEGVVAVAVIAMAANGSPVFAPRIEFVPEEYAPLALRWEAERLTPPGAAPPEMERPPTE